MARAGLGGAGQFMSGPAAFRFGHLRPDGQGRQHELVTPGDLLGTGLAATAADLVLSGAVVPGAPEPLALLERPGAGDAGPVLGAVPRGPPCSRCRRCKPAGRPDVGARARRGVRFRRATAAVVRPSALGGGAVAPPGAN
jgi:hypothetical protein